MTKVDRTTRLKDVGLTNAVANLREAARQLLNFERAHRFELCASRRNELTRLSAITLDELLDEAGWK